MRIFCNWMYGKFIHIILDGINRLTLFLFKRDHDPEETVQEKIRKISKVKDFREIGILLKEIAVTTKTSDKSIHQFLGQLDVPLKSIPLTGLESWYPLEGRDKVKDKERGEIQLNLFLSTSRTESQSTLKESFTQYERLVKIVVEYQLRTDSNWRGELPDYLLQEFAAHRGLRQPVTDVCSWSVFSTLLHKRTLDFTMLLSLIQRLRRAIVDGKLTENDLLDVFWTATDSFVETALSAIHHLRSNSELNTNSIQLSALLQ